MENRSFYNEILTEHNVRPEFKHDLPDADIVLEGVGFDTDMLYRKETPTGMKRIRERLEKIGAVLEVVSRPGKGTIVTVRFPKKKINIERAE